MAQNRLPFVTRRIRNTEAASPLNDDHTIAEPKADEATGIPAGNLPDSSSYSPTGNHPHQHWKSSTVAEPGLDQRGTVFFAALQMTRMPMIITDPRQPDNPIAFANKAFFDLTGYEEAEVVGRNCRFLQGAGGAMIGLSALGSAAIAPVETINAASAAKRTIIKPPCAGRRSTAQSKLKS